MPGKEFSIYGKHSHKKNKLKMSPNEILLSNFFFFFFFFLAEATLECQF